MKFGPKTFGAEAGRKRNAMDLHRRIMNIPFAVPDDVAWTHGEIQAAKIGHRDARHAAAELALEADACMQALRDGLGRSPGRADFEAWAISAGFAYRNEHGFWFYRNGGEGMWEAYCAGAASPASARTTS